MSIVSPTCCPDYASLPAHKNCFLEGICSELKYLEHRRKSTFVKRKRLHELAKPICRSKVYVHKCPCILKKPIEVIRLYKPNNTRTEQLAFPPVRKLLDFKKTWDKIMNQTRKEAVNRNIRLSLLSLYSRLQNIQPPEPHVPIPKWTPAEWKTHTRYLKKLAKAKVPPSPPVLPVNRMPLKQMNRFKLLAKPKVRIELLKEDWEFTPAMKYYEASDRLNVLATPQSHDNSGLFQELPAPVDPLALQYRATKRIKLLATPHEKRTEVDPDIRDDAFTISPNALKAKPRKRILELAEPKEFENTHIRDNPNFISPAALKAVATPRTIELAKPKNS